MKYLSPAGSVRERFFAARGREAGDAWHPGGGDDDLQPSYFAWEIARCAPGLGQADTRALAALASACVVAVRGGSTRLSVRGPQLAASLFSMGSAVPESAAAVQSIIARARAGDPDDPVTHVIGGVGERKPLILEGDWLYPERLRILEERFCGRVRERLSGGRPQADARSSARALASVAAGPPPLTDEQRRAVREALRARLALVTGGPGTGKTTIVVALLRALAWLGVPMATVAIAAPTGKAAQRLREAISLGLARAPRGIAEAGLAADPPPPQTLHRLLGWSPSSGRFARHENDPLPHRVVVVDEASMVDLSMMDRLFRALGPQARLVLLGDTHQLPSVEAGAVFRDLCSGLGAVTLSANLRVDRDPSARRIVSAARAVNLGRLGALFEDSVPTRRSVRELTFTGVELLDERWAKIGDELLERWWSARVESLAGFAQLAARTYRANDGAFYEEDRACLQSLLEHHARARLLCATRTLGDTSAEEVNRRLVARLDAARPRRRSRGRSPLAPGAPVVMDRNDYDRGLYNGDQGLVVRVQNGVWASSVELMAVFPRGDSFRAYGLDTLDELSLSFAMTVHKAQGSEFDDVAVLLPETDLPVSTRELVYTAMTRARRSVLLVASADLLARAVSRSIERHSGIAENLHGSAHVGDS